jgi:hypothetical protein
VAAEAGIDLHNAYNQPRVVGKRIDNLMSGTDRLQKNSVGQTYAQEQGGALVQSAHQGNGLDVDTLLIGNTSGQSNGQKAAEAAEASYSS